MGKEIQMKRLLVIGIILTLLTASSALAGDLYLYLPHEKVVKLPPNSKAHSATHSQKSQVYSVTITPTPPPPTTPPPPSF